MLCPIQIIQDDQLSRLVSFHNVFISGHQAFLTREVNQLPQDIRNITDWYDPQALSAIARTTVQNLKSIEDGTPCPNAVTTQVNVCPKV